MIFLKYFFTIRYLKLSQLFWQCVRRLSHPKVSLYLNCVTVNPAKAKWMLSIKSEHRFFEDDKITFLSQSVLFDKNIFRNGKTQSRLWQYNLHYFQGLLSSDDVTVKYMVELLQLWVVECRFYEKIPCDPYVISIRIGNCIKFYLNGGHFSPEILKSLYLQARYLHKIPEYQLLGNHLLEWLYSFEK